MAWLGIICGIILVIIVVVVVITSIKTAALNKDPGQKEKLGEIVDLYKSFKAGSINAMDFQSKTTIILMGSKNKHHLASMVKTYATMDMPQSEANELYQTVHGLVVYIDSNT